MDTCEICAEMGNSDNCDNCRLGNPCLDCEHDKSKKDDCCGQCVMPIKEIKYETKIL